MKKCDNIAKNTAEVTLEIIILDGLYHVRHYRLGEPDQEIIRLFGSDAVPTPYLADAPPDLVLNQIKSLNPNVCVYLAPNTLKRYKDYNRPLI